MDRDRDIVRKWGGGGVVGGTKARMGPMGPMGRICGRRRHVMDRSINQSANSKTMTARAAARKSGWSGQSAAPRQRV